MTDAGRVRKWLQHLAVDNPEWADYILDVNARSALGKAIGALLREVDEANARCEDSITTGEMVCALARLALCEINRLNASVVALDAAMRKEGHSEH